MLGRNQWHCSSEGRGAGKQGHAESGKDPLEIYLTVRASSRTVQEELFELLDEQTLFLIPESSSKIRLEKVPV